MIAKEITVEAVIENVDTVTDFVRGLLQAAGCPERLQTWIAVTIDEVFSNIAYYAYAPERGTASVGVLLDDASVTLTFADSGRPFDPLAREDPDITRKLEDREIGGLGIYMVKRIASELRYAYADGRNVLTAVFAR